MREEMTTLGESCQFFNGKAHEKDIDAEGKYVVVNSKFISRDGKVRKFTGKQMFPLFEDDIVMVMSDVPNGKALAKCYIIEENEKYSLNQRICAIRTTEFDIRFLYYQLNRNPFFLAFNNCENQSNLRKGDILNCPLWKPSLEIQEEITQLLDDSLEQLEEAKANIEQNILNAKELFQSKLTAIFSQKVNGWEEKTLGEVCEKTKNIKWQDFSSEDFEYVDLSSVSRETLSVTETATVNKENAPSRAKKIILEGDVIFATTRPTLKRATIIDEELSGNLCSTGYVVLRPKENISSDWIFFYLLTSKFMDRMESLQRGASYPAVSDNDVKDSKLSVPILKLEEKKDILTMNNLQENTNFLIDNYINKLNDLEDLKKSILQKTFTGELTQNAVAV